MFTFWSKDWVMIAGGYRKQEKKGDTTVQTKSPEGQLLKKVVLGPDEERAKEY